MLDLQVRRWETSTRYFEAWIYRDLFGETVLTAVNGGRGNRLGMVRVVAVGQARIDAELEDIAKRRLSHGYRECTVPRAGGRPVPHRLQDLRVVRPGQRIGDQQVRDGPRRKLPDRVVKHEELINAGALHKVQDGRLATQIR
jgi:hypothetical protein